MAFDWWVFGVGCFGGFLAELVRWWNLRESLDLPAYAGRWTYWLITVLMILAGGILAWLQRVPPDQLLLALNVGVSAPLIVMALAKIVPGQPAPGANPRRFLAIK